MNQMLQCPKCRGTMRTYNRSGVHIEQCDSCRGIFLDYGELESLAQLEGRFAGPPPPAPGMPGPGMHAQPGWGGHGGHHGHYRQRSLGKMLFSS